MPPKSADEQLAELRQAVACAPKYGLNGRELLLQAALAAAQEDSDEDDEPTLSCERSRCACRSARPASWL